MPVHDWTKVYSGMFHDFHQSWTIRIKDALNSSGLPSGMTALVEQKMGSKEPDLLTVDQWAPRDDDASYGGGLATMAPPSTRVVRKSSKEFYSDLANRIVVKHRLGRTVAVIEIVSPGNKDSKRAFKEFVDKSLQFITSGVHLLVVDLFPPTKRDPHGVHRVIWDEFEDEDELFEFPEGKDRILASYNSGREKAAYVEPIAIGDAMRDMPLYLSDSYYVPVPLEAAYQTTWSMMQKEMQEYVKSGELPKPGEM